MEGVHSGGVEKILKYMGGGGVCSGRGSSPLHEEIINKIGLHWGGFPHARPTMQNPDHVDGALNQSSKNLRKKLY